MKKPNWEPIQIRVEQAWDFARSNSLTWGDFKTDLLGRIVHMWHEDLLRLSKRKTKRKP